VAYSYITFGQAKQLLANRLGDAGKVFWPDGELGEWIKEALRFWNISAHANYQSEVFVTASTQPFYDLYDYVLPRTLTDRQVIESVQRHLNEPVDGTTWNGTEQFSYQDLVDSITYRMNRLMAESGLAVSRSTDQSIVTGVVSTTLPDTYEDLRRAATVSPSSTRPLRRMDTVTARAYLPRYPQQSGAPTVYSQLTSRPLAATLLPRAAETLGLDLLYISSLTSTLTPSTSSTILPIHDDFCAVVKWGVMADLLMRDGPGMDVERAKYCEERYEEGVELAKIAQGVRALFVASVPIPLTTMQRMDEMLPRWQNSSGVPTCAAIEGLNQLALYPVPDGAYSIEVELLDGAVLPSADSDYLQVSRDELDVVLDYAQHLAAFKLGGMEWQSTLPAYQRLMQAASRRNERLMANSGNFPVLRSTAEREEAGDPSE